MSERSVSIVGLGLVCALGADVDAARSGYAEGARPFVRAPTLLGTDGLPTTIAPALPYPGPYADYPARLAALLAGALSGLARPGAVLRVVLPAWIAGTPVAARVGASIGAAIGNQVLAVQTAYGGPAEALSLIVDQAMAVLRGDADSVIVGAADSALHPELLDRLAMQGRVSTRTNPYGGVPAEGAALFLLAAGNAIPDAAALGEVLAVFHGQEAEDVAQPKGVIGRGLAHAYRQAAAYCTPHRLISDMNGERWRAEEFGFALAAAGPALSGLEVEAPALHLGDCGTAMGPIMAALALCSPPARRPGRQPGPGGPVSLVSASSPSGLRAAMMLERTEAA